MELFGSQLIKKLFPDFRNPRDFDYVSNDIHDFAGHSNKVERYYIPCTPDREMTANEIYTVKVSHAIYSINWQKHMPDIRFLQLKGCQVIPIFLAELREFWKSVHTDKKYSRFDFSAKEDIFDDNLGRKEPHDNLHLLFTDELDFPKFSDGAIPNEDKWNKLSDEMKNKICMEEAYVIALERFYGKFPMRKAYCKAQELLITRLHPLFIADWAIQNWKEIYTPRKDYYAIYERTH